METETKAPPKAPRLKQEASNTLIEEYLVSKYNFRFNSVKYRPEFKSLLTGDSDKWQQLNDYELNSIRRELYTFGLNTSSGNLYDIIMSNFSPLCNPVKEWFKNLKPFAPTGEIKKLADTVSMVNSYKWNEYLTKWLVATVANLFDDNLCRNHTCIVLTGDQGAFKTTWLELLCPDDLKEYLYTGKIQPENKDSLIILAEFLFVNIDDQLRQLNKKDENELKNIITLNYVKCRRPYSRLTGQWPRMASFMGSVNGNEFLTDVTGNRRFLPFEVESIDIEAAKKIDMKAVYKEAMYLWQDGFKYFFDKTETDFLNKHNETFSIKTNEEEALIRNFKIPDQNAFELDIKEMTNTEVLTYLTQRTQLKLNQKRLGEALKKHGFDKHPKRINDKVIYIYKLQIINS